MNRSSDFGTWLNWWRWKVQHGLQHNCGSSPLPTTSTSAFWAPAASGDFSWAIRDRPLNVLLLHWILQIELPYSSSRGSAALWVALVGYTSLAEVEGVSVRRESSLVIFFRKYDNVSISAAVVHTGGLSEQIKEFYTHAKTAKVVFNFNLFLHAI